MKKRTRFLSACLCFVLTIGIFSIYTASANLTITAKADGVSVDVGQSIENPFIAPAGVTYTSSAPSIATVSPTGVITGVAMGNATITASGNGYSDTCTVSVGFQKGIDVSTYQGKLDWAKIKKEGIEFAFIRMASGRTKKDNQLENNVKGATANNVPYGFYFYSYAKDIAGVKDEANLVLNLLTELDKKGGYAANASLPVVFDIEDPSQKGFGKTKLTEMTVTFCDMIAAAGYKPMVYANQDWFTNRLDLATFTAKGYSLWLARWPDKPNFKKKIQIGTTGYYPHVWQYTSDGTVAGVRTDMNVMYYDTISQIHKSYESNMGGLTFSKIEDYIYTGQSYTPDFTVYDGEKVLTPNVDFTAVYENNTNAGVAKIVLTGMGEYRGSRTITFNILPKEVELKVEPIADMPYAAEPIIPDAVVTANGGNLQRDVDYVLQATNNTQLGVATLDVVCIGNYSGKATTTFNIVQKDLADITVNEIPKQIYSGAPLTPTLPLFNGANPVIPNTDYTSEYKDNINVGKGYATVVGQGNYKGEITVLFSIIPKTIDKVTAKTVSKSKIKLTWKSVPQATGYKIYDTKTKQFIKTVKGTSATVTKRKAGSVNYFKVCAYTIKDNEEFTAVLSPYVKIATTPEKPTLTTKKGKVTAKWKKATNSSGYVVQYAYNHKMKGAKKIRVKKAATVKKTIKLTLGKTVYLRVRIVTKQNGKERFTPYSAKRKIKIK